MATLPGRWGNQIPQDSLRRSKHVPRQASAGAQTQRVSTYDAYTYALRGAYLNYLLQPRSKRLQHVTTPAQKTPSSGPSTSAADMMKDLSIARDPKSMKLPNGFMAELDKRITGVLVGKEKMPEYADALVKRTFAVFLNEFKKPEFRKSVEKDRRVEDLLLIFFSNATKELAKGKQQGDSSWKLMVDRHVALFIRLVSSTLQANDWSRDRPELANRLSSLEKKLLVHDMDLSSQSDRGDGQGGTTTEVEVPRSYNVKDMSMVLTVAEIFDKSSSQVQTDVNEQKDLWTEKAALQDLKTYQTSMSLNSKNTLRGDDFDTNEGYENWKKSEIPELSQMMLAIIQSNMELAKSTPASFSQLKINVNGGVQQYGDLVESPRTYNERNSPGAFPVNHPVDFSALGIFGEPNTNLGEDEPVSYMFIPPEPRFYYRQIVRQAFYHDVVATTASIVTSPEISEGNSSKLLSKKSNELLHELGMRWRLPLITRLLVFVDVAREKYVAGDISLDTLNAAFVAIRDPTFEKKKVDVSKVFDESKWTLADFTLNQQILRSVNDSMLRALFEQMLHCYEPRPPDISDIMVMLEDHVYSNPSFVRADQEMENFSFELQGALRQNAYEQYQKLYDQHIEKNRNALEFYHVMELGKAVLKMCEKIQKRYRRNPEIMGVEPFRILVVVLLPQLASDMYDQLSLILEQAAQRQEEIPIQDGFDLYKELVEIRRVHTQALPDMQFAFDVEQLLSPFIWRWIEAMDSKMTNWVEAAFQQDDFTIPKDESGLPSSNDERHSISVVDIFRSFNQAVGQIIQINWDNDVQYAKFMTALSKSVGAGIARYCELLEQAFAQEMDRAAQSQEAVAARTRQEKFLKLAKDVMSSKEKVEPFHFLPESFVKLNNVEYAMIQLDKLEKEMNVDACVDVLKRTEPQQQSKRSRKNERHVFTIKIIEAEDLRACDSNGLSDPYVILGDELQKRLAKTRIVYANLNPRWDETVDITTNRALSITATIWDWDAIGNHGCIGRTTIKLDPAHFSDYLPREYWLDLDTQGRLLLRITMEGEKDDIQFYYGKAFRMLKRSEREMSRIMTDKLTPFIHHVLSRRTLKSLTKQGGINLTTSINTVSSYFNRSARQTTVQGVAPTAAEIDMTLKPLFTYLDDNFAIMKQTLTASAMIIVMTRIWKEVLTTIESLLVPSLSDKLSSQTPISQVELDTVFKWLQLLFEFFHAVDEESGQAYGVPIDVLKSPKYHDLQNLYFFYYEGTENLIRISERITKASSDRARGQQQLQDPRSTRPVPTSIGSLHSVPTTRRTKSIMHTRNLGTMRKAKAEKRKEAQAEPSDDIILRILRMRPEAESYLRNRSKMREKLAAQSMADALMAQATRDSRRGYSNG